MEENHIPMPTGVTPAPAPSQREETAEPQQAPEAETKSDPKTTPIPEKQETEEEDGDNDSKDFSLRDVDPVLLIVCSALLGATLPLLNIILPFILWILWREKDPRIDEAGKAVLNVQLTAFLWVILALLTIPVGIGTFLLPLTLLGWACATIVHILKTSNMDYDWRPPGTIPFLR